MVSEMFFAERNGQKFFARMTIVLEDEHLFGGDLLAREGIASSAQFLEVDLERENGPRVHNIFL